MLPYSLNYQLGNATNQLTLTERVAATQFQVTNNKDSDGIVNIPIV
jgi:hypothetical protein